MLPNGIFITDTNYHIFETRDYIAQNPNCTFATQSGPLLPARKHLSSAHSAKQIKYIRNGVGVSSTVNRIRDFNQRVNFYVNSRFSKTYGRSNALYFDGNVSKLRPNWDVRALAGPSDQWSPR